MLANSTRSLQQPSAPWSAPELQETWGTASGLGLGLGLGKGTTTLQLTPKGDVVVFGTLPSLKVED